MEMIISIFLALSVVINILLVISSFRLHNQYKCLELKYDLLDTAYHELYIKAKIDEVEDTNDDDVEDTNDDDVEDTNEDGHDGIAKPYSGFEI